LSNFPFIKDVEPAHKKKWSPSRDKLYLSCDGDGTGSQVSSSVFHGDVQSARKLSLMINIAGDAVMHHLIRDHKCSRVIQGGDDIMVEMPSSEWDDSVSEHIRDIFYEYTGFTLSVGLGDTPVEAAKSLVIAKDTGKDRTVFWSPNKEKSYKKAIESKAAELKMKLKASGGLE
jgi:hypothetical protein